MASGHSRSPEYLREYSGGTLIAVAIAFIVLDLLFVGLRELARHRTKATWGWDDYLILPALVVNISLCIHGIVMVGVGGVGHHLDAVLMFHPHQVVGWAKCIYALEIIYLPAVALPKLSILSLYFRLFPNQLFRAMTLFLVVVMLLNWLAFIFASTFKCSPVAYQWDKSIQGGHCFDVLLYYRLVNVPNIVTDIAMLILPMPMVWKLHTSRPRKVGLTICFLAGSVAIRQARFLDNRRTEHVSHRDLFAGPTTSLPETATKGHHLKAYKSFAFVLRTP
ncbi:MAG: hypothetical protein Q9207_006803 [Kuettlingeria erythrocarpa]